MEPGGEAAASNTSATSPTAPTANSASTILRDNMKERVDLQVQGPLDFAIVDEVDSILIDEARTPLIISGFAHDDAPKYRAADIVARKVIELNRPWDAAEKAVDAPSARSSPPRGMQTSAKTKEEKEAARKRGEQAAAALAEAEKKKEGTHAILRGGTGPQERSSDARRGSPRRRRRRAWAASMSATTWNGRI
jgi:hypothetical protein